MTEGSQEIGFVISPTGHSMVVWQQTSTDKTGSSYYGGHYLMYVQVYAGNKRKEIKVFENQVSDVKWSPSGENFIVISGKMPATCTVYTKDCVPKFEFGKLYMNTVKYSPHDDLVLLGGFKSLAGDLLFWDKQDISNIHLIGKNNSHSSI